ncbi:MAG TPA: hypothetical protein VFZ65_13715 [Planctomycetota bacterium]|nr:hypothetical protein [Planctomycetota bacterium]
MRTDILTTAFAGLFCMPLSAQWQQVATATSPVPRAHAAMAYGMGGIVMFGGDIALPLFPWSNDTWWYDGVDWTRLSPATSPGRKTCTQRSGGRTPLQGHAFRGRGP